MNAQIPIRLKLFFSHVLAVLLVSGSIGTYFYTSAADSLLTGLQERLQSSAALISQMIDADQLRANYEQGGHDPDPIRRSSGTTQTTQANESGYRLPLCHAAAG